MASIRRTAADEEGDCNQALKNFDTEAYLDWPNEAGVGSMQPRNST